jgi:predicted nuclease with RNAse H fold
MRTVVGIDLAGKTTNRTVIAVLRGNQKERLRYDLFSRTPEGRHLPDVGGLVRIIDAHRPELVAVDAPLTLPHQVVCRDDSCDRCIGEEASGSYTQRSADRATRWRDVGHNAKEPMATVMIAAVAFRGVYLRRLLEGRGIRVIETWPVGVLRALGGLDEMPSKSNQEAMYIAWAHAALVGAGFNVPSVATDHEIDALAAAVAGWEHLANRTVPVGDDDEGRIWIPKRQA